MFKKKGVPVDVNKIVNQLKTTAAKFGLGFGDRTMTYNSRLAQEVGLWAESKDIGHKFHMNVFKAYFVQGLNIGLKDVLIDLIESSFEEYPSVETYSLLGPNSNTYTQWVLDQFPETKMQLPWNAVGKKYCLRP